MLFPIHQRYKFESKSQLTQNRDLNDRFCKPYLMADSGRRVSDDDVNGDIGSIDFDGDYDRYYVIDAEDMDDRERRAVREVDGYISDDLQEILDEEEYY